jgi:hypothetical protein
MSNDFYDVEYVERPVYRGDTVRGIAAIYGVPVDAIFAFNPDLSIGIDADLLLLRNELRIPLNQAFNDLFAAPKHEGPVKESPFPKLPLGSTWIGPALSPPLGPVKSRADLEAFIELPKGPQPGVLGAPPDGGEALPPRASCDMLAESVYVNGHCINMGMQVSPPTCPTSQFWDPTKKECAPIYGGGVCGDPQYPVFVATVGQSGCARASQNPDDIVYPTCPSGKEWDRRLASCMQTPAISDEKRMLLIGGAAGLAAAAAIALAVKLLRSK